VNILKGELGRGRGGIKMKTAILLYNTKIAKDIK